MSTFLLFALTGVVLFSLGFHALVTRPHLVHKLLALNVMGSGVFLLLVATAFRNRAPAPDPVPHALVLTGIVVAVSVTAFALALARRLHAVSGDATLPDEEGLE